MLKKATSATSVDVLSVNCYPAHSHDQSGMPFDSLKLTDDDHKERPEMDSRDLSVWLPSHLRSPLVYLDGRVGAHDKCQWIF